VAAQSGEHFFMYDLVHVLIDPKRSVEQTRKGIKELSGVVEVLNQPRCYAGSIVRSEWAAHSTKVAVDTESRTHCHAPRPACGSLHE